MPGVFAALIVFVVEDLQDFRIFRILGPEGVHFQVAELSGEIQVLVGRDVLIAEEEHLIVHEGRTERRSQFFAYGLLQVDPIDGGANRWAQRVKGQP